MCDASGGTIASLTMLLKSQLHYVLYLRAIDAEIHAFPHNRDSSPGWHSYCSTVEHSLYCRCPCRKVVWMKITTSHDPVQGGKRCLNQTTG
jgi:hypothetical protein